MLYETFYYGEQNFYVIDLIEDKIIWDAKNNTNRSLVTYSEDDLKTLVHSTAKRYNIEPINCNIGEFPYKENTREYHSIASNERRPDPNRAIFEIEIFIKQNFSPNKMKRINTIKDIHVSNRHNKISENLVFWYAKSPFENRIAVLIGVPQTNEKWNFLYYKYYIFGCLLTSGFVLD